MFRQVFGLHTLPCGGLACRQLPAACVSAATAPYGGPTTTDGQLALAALTNTACYVRGGGVLTPPAYGTLGDAGRGIFTGQNYYNVDFSVSKIWKLKERYSAQFRAEFFNLLNRADFAGSSTAGGTAVWPPAPVQESAEVSVTPRSRRMPATRCSGRAVRATSSSA